MRELLIVAALLLAPSAMWGGSVLLSPGGSVRLGVHDTGSLGWSGTGLRLVGLGDAISPGCMCESWGVSVNGTTSGYAYPYVYGVNNLTTNSFSSTATTATSAVTLNGTGLRITQAYAPSGYEGIFQGTVTLTNNGPTNLTDVRYARAVDWDVPPTEFSEYVTIHRGGSTALLYSNDNGFAVPNPLSPGAALNAATQNANVVDHGPDDHGSLFVFGFGNLAPGESKIFNLFYGATASEAAALAGLSVIGAQVYSLGQSSGAGGPATGSPGTFLLAFNGVSVPLAPVPEPATIVLFGGICAAVVASLRSKALQRS
jgi:type IV pilus assembly protein PilY1